VRVEEQEEHAQMKRWLTPQQLEDESVILKDQAKNEAESAAKMEQAQLRRKL